MELETAVPAGGPPAAAPIVAAFQGAADAKAKLRLLLDYARELPPFPEELKVAENRVMGCTAQVRCAARLAAAYARGSRSRRRWQQAPRSDHHARQLLWPSSTHCHQQQPASPPCSR